MVGTVTLLLVEEGAVVFFLPEFRTLHISSSFFLRFFFFIERTLFPYTRILFFI